MSKTIYETLDGKKGKETIFKSYLNAKKEIVFEENKASIFGKVIYLGCSKHYGDTFLCGSISDPENFGIYFGEKGTEF